MLFFVGPKINFLKNKKKDNAVDIKNLKQTQSFFLKKNFFKTNLKKSETEEKQKLDPESVFFQGPPSISELVIPTLSILTVIGILPFIATLVRQFWVRYTITNRRISVDSGFKGQDRVEIVYRDIKKVSKITRFGGLTADVVIVLKDNARLELRSLPEWEKNMEFINDNIIEKSE
mmetsp:Transcript_17915/g.35010  ORF Transcript_17915/g.35010 Transcript_17915/m.35010 type:complete len:175 (-) Transcript_17915:682-1206(-)